MADRPSCERERCESTFGGVIDPIARWSVRFTLDSEPIAACSACAKTAAQLGALILPLGAVGV